jgi:hypothetical protein
VVLKEEAVGRVRVDLQPSLWDKACNQVTVERQDHGVAVAVCNEHRHIDCTQSLQEAEVWAAPRADRVILSKAGLPGRRAISVLLSCLMRFNASVLPPCSWVIGRKTRPGSHRGSAQVDQRPR